jgi:hypothetical protein
MTDMAWPEGKRPLCKACGNLTRWDVVMLRKTSGFYHFTVGGMLNVEEEKVLDEVIREISCRWCGNGDNVEWQDNPAEVDSSTSAG